MILKKMVTGTKDNKNEIEILKKDFRRFNAKSGQTTVRTLNYDNAAIQVIQNNNSSNTASSKEEELFIKQLVDDYNSVIDKQQDEQSFKSKYKPERFDVTNAMNRKKDLSQRSYIW